MGYQFVPNERQRQAIEHIDGPMLVVAGAGTGKTTVLSRRIAHLIASGHARADEILAVTYTDAAAVHLKAKVAEALGERDSGVHAYTFHGYCLMLLKGSGRDVRIVDDRDLWILLRRRIEELPLQLFRPARDPGEFLNALSEFFSRCSDELVNAARYRAYVDDAAAGIHPLPRVAPSKKDALLSSEDKLARCREIAAVFSHVEAMLAAESLWTFGNTITGAVALLKNNPIILEKARQHARFILVDEFQDANVAQIELVRLLAGDEKNIFAVGDPDQAIYRFRGASSAAFEEFLKRFPATRGVVLNENQRSTSHILACAHSIVSRNPEVDCRIAENLEFHRQALVSARQARHSGITPAPMTVVLGDKFQEAADVASEIERLLTPPPPPRRDDQGPPIAVIYRMHAHASELIYELAARSIPVAVKGIDALETGDGRDLIAALGAVASLSHAGDLFRISALPFFGLDGVKVRETLNSAGREASFISLLGRIPDGVKVIARIESARAFAASVEWQAVAVCDFIIREFAFDAAAAPIQRIASFVREWSKKAITTTGKLEEFIEYLEYFAEAGGKLDITPDNTGAPVHLMTVHSAKGLEFEHVFVLRANAGSFPSSYREEMFEFPPELREMKMAGDAKQLHKNEERRLFYVALTRAKDHLSVHAKPGRGRNPKPDGFLRDLMDDRSASADWKQRNAAPYKVRKIEAGTAIPSGVATWMLLPPSARLTAEPVLSVSAMEDFDACPLKYKLRREWSGIPGPISASVSFGNLMHEVLRDIHQAEIAGRPRTEADVLLLFSNLMNQARFDDPLQERLYREQGARQLAEYVRLRRERERPPVLSAENNFQVKVAGVPVKGRMDRVDGPESGRRVVDFKTGSPFTQEKADRSLQLGIYAVAARELWGAPPKELVIYNLDGNVEIVSTRDADALAAVEEKVITVAAAIADAVAHGEFIGREGFHCQWCDFRSVCPQKEQRLYSVTRAAATN